MAAFLVKQKCKCSSSQNNEESPTIDASDILEGDYENESTANSVVEMTDSEREKPTRSLEYIPNAFGTAPPHNGTNNTMVRAALV